ncbi:MAG: LysM domain-containing protein [Ginsengibacter sp.]
MTDPFQTILQAGKRPANNFPVSSRYYAAGTSTLESADSLPILYLKRRFIPPSEKLELITEHTVKKGDRLDNMAASYIGDPEQFWQIADANNAMKPEELTEEAGAKLRITQPDGIHTF